VNEAAMERYRNRWIAIQADGAVIADAEDLDGLLKQLKGLPDAKASIQRVPSADEPLFVGLR
jgi:Family of unknown function (DUF5678)